jgi:hypothetical protein
VRPSPLDPHLLSAPITASPNVHPMRQLPDCHRVTITSSPAHPMARWPNAAAQEHLAPLRAAAEPRSHDALARALRPGPYAPFPGLSEGDLYPPVPTYTYLWLCLGMCPPMVMVLFIWPAEGRRANWCPRRDGPLAVAKGCLGRGGRVLQGVPLARGARWYTGLSVLRSEAGGGGGVCVWGGGGTQRAAVEGWGWGGGGEQWAERQDRAREARGRGARVERA